MNKLIAYLRENMILDFQGDLTLEMIRGFLEGDSSREARTLMAKLIEERNVNEMMIVLADCLVDTVRQALRDEVISEQLSTYAES